jgi:hypothetical protein
MLPDGTLSAPPLEPGLWARRGSQAQGMELGRRFPPSSLGDAQEQDVDDERDVDDGVNDPPGASDGPRRSGRDGNEQREEHEQLLPTPLRPQA